jgi:hypothetical protein
MFPSCLLLCRQWTFYAAFATSTSRITHLLTKDQKVRDYTDEHYPDSGGFSFGSDRAIWNNDGIAERYMM